MRLAVASAISMHVWWLQRALLWMVVCACLSLSVRVCWCAVVDDVDVLLYVHVVGCGVVMSVSRCVLCACGGV